MESVRNLLSPVVPVATTLTLITRIRAAGIHSLDIWPAARKCGRFAKLRKFDPLSPCHLVTLSPCHLAIPINLSR